MLNWERGAKHKVSDRKRATSIRNPKKTQPRRLFFHLQVPRRRAIITAAAIAVPPTPIAECVVGPALWDLAVSTGELKSKAPLSKVLPLSVLAGAFIGFGASLALSLGGCMAPGPVQRLAFGAVGFQVGLLAIAVTGAELFTGNAFLFASALLEKRATVEDVLPRAAVCWLGNLAGVAAVAALLVLGSSGVGPSVAGAASPASAALPPPPSAAPAAALAAAKASLPAVAAFSRAVLCNVCVCVAVVQAASARSMAGKAVGIWLPLSCFASLGLEHSVANMFFFALAAFSGAGAPLAGVLGNLAVVSLGNVVGAAAVLAGLLKLGHGRS